MRRRIMISYSTKQRALADRLYERLEVEHAPKLDWLDIGVGERFQETLAWWLSACHVAVVLVSEDALASQWVRYELSVLVNRERTVQDVKLILLLLEGLDRDAVSASGELKALDLANIHSVELPSEPTDAELDALLQQAIPAGDGEAFLDRIAGEMHRFVEAPVAINDVATARSRLQAARTGEEDPWFDDPQLATAADGGVQLRWALARELCATPLHGLYGPVQALMKDRGIRERVYELLDLNLSTAFDTAAIKTLHDLFGGERRSAVLGFTSLTLAEIVPAAVTRMHSTNDPFAFVVQGPFTGDDHEQTADGIADQLETAVAMSKWKDRDRLLALAKRREHPFYVLITCARGLRGEVLGLLEQRFEGVGWVVLASRELDPDGWSAQLGGVAVAGPRLRGEAWSALVDAELDLLKCRMETRDDLAFLAGGEQDDEAA